jgi:hypothetical protein
MTAQLRDGRDEDLALTRLRESLSVLIGFEAAAACDFSMR